MKAVVLCIFATLAASKVTSIPWPEGFKYPSSYVSKSTNMIPSGTTTYKPDFSTQQA